MNTNKNNYPIGYRTKGTPSLVMTEEGWRADTKPVHHHKNGWDYCRPWTYMITLNCQHHDVLPMPVASSEASSNASEASSRCSEASLGEINRRKAIDRRLQELYSHKGKPHLFGELVMEECAAPASSAAQRPASEVQGPSCAQGSSSCAPASSCAPLPASEAPGPSCAPVSSSEARLGECYPRIRLSRFGQLVERAIDELPQGLPIVILERVVMPNHVHFVIRVLEQLPKKKPLGKIIQDFKTTVNQIYKTLRGIPLTTRMQYPGCEGKHPTAGLVFAIDYHERFLFREGQLRAMIEYCRDNPARLAAQLLHPEFFERICSMQVTLPWLPQGGTKGQRSAGIDFPNLLAPVLLSEARLGAMTATFTLDAIGNRALLMEPERVQIQCSRSMTAEALEEETAAVLDMCSMGMVPVCPCMNSNERHIAEACLSAGYRLIIIEIEGLRPDLPEYKPMGQRFRACQKGQLLLLSPWVSAALRGVQGAALRGVPRSNELGSPRSNKPTRAECLFQNDLAAMLTAYNGRISNF